MRLTFLSTLALIFITLKLTGFISWSWWWVLAPLWLGAAIWLGLFVVGCIVITIKHFLCD